MSEAEAESTEGGPEWERNQAAQLWAEASASGDAGRLALAANRMGDAVVNSVASRLIDGLLTTFGGLVRKEIGGVREEIARQGDIRRAQFGELRAEGDARQQAILSELGRQDLALGGLEAGQQRLQAGFRGVSDGVAALGETVSGLLADVADLRLQLGTIGRAAQDRYDSLDNRVDALARREDDRDALKNARLGRIEAELTDLRRILVELDQAVLGDRLTRQKREILTDAIELLAPHAERLAQMAREDTDGNG